MSSITIAEALRVATQKLQMNSSTPQLDAEILLSYVLNKPRSYLLAYAEQPLAAKQQQYFDQLIARRQQGEPVAYIIGKKEFWSMLLTVTKDTLIPRPETELLVELILSLFPNQVINIADLGTGCGAIALALAKERPQWQIVAADQSLAALNVARQNADNLRLINVQFYQSNWYQGLPTQTFHAIVSNPPYIAIQDPHLRQDDLGYEPLTALVSGEDGLADIRTLITKAPGYLETNGWLLLEHGYNQAAEIQQLYKAAGFRNITLHRDLAGIPRVTSAQM